HRSDVTQCPLPTQSAFFALAFIDNKRDSMASSGPSARLAPKVRLALFCYIFTCRNRGFLIVIPPSSPRCRPFGAALAIYVIRSASGVHDERFSSSTCPLGRTFTHRQSIANTMASDILIVDDEADICELVAGILKDEGHGTRTARDSDEALSAVVARRPNL